MERISTLNLLHKQHLADKQQCSQLLSVIEKQNDSATLQHHILSFWKNDLQKHIEAEDKILVPFLKAHGFNSSYINILYREHDTIRLLAQRLSLLNGDGQQFCKTFVKLVDEHISFEDEVVFPKMQKMIAPEELEKLEKKMANA
ncbi:MAG: hemerythrin domain-containing protein [Chitinophagaceae bacterium]